MDQDNALTPAVVQQLEAKLREMIPRSQEDLLRAHVLQLRDQGDETRSREIRYRLQDELYALEELVQRAISNRRKEVIKIHHAQETALDNLINMRKELPKSWKTAAKAVLRDRASFHGVTNASIISITAERQERSRNLLRLLIAAEKAR
ncbi:hypothetical protein BCR35DRAFT_312999 [Leucosporidium creatinivorum]|uniref:Uncharacterized protein n=1 Tax=Leucosporidium creatinivorum TaxID=106004 RepID=A0A1Y2FXJ9_9BASI|nr:hypothetical protein BCR35DRAFT_312999 [Leucosporidium creatinivorum]